MPYHVVFMKDVDVVRQCEVFAFLTQILADVYWSRKQAILMVIRVVRSGHFDLQLLSFRAAMIACYLFVAVIHVVQGFTAFICSPQEPQIKCTHNLQCKYGL